ncbi:MAG: DNA primase [Acidimicrobiales bacterium]
MGIVDDDIARVKAATDLVQVASEHVGVRKVGRNWVGLCPFHAESTPSFNINPELGFYHCYGCQASGDAITFVREVHHLDFVESVEWLASRAGIQLRYDDENTTRDRGRKKTLIEAMERAVEWYHDRLLTSADAGAARSYLRDRGYDGEVVRRFKLGWAPDDWDALSRSLKLPLDVLSDIGLGFKNKRGRLQDSFRARLLFPIFDAAGKPVAFGGRILPGGDGPKYKNSAESAIYAKSRTLYALNWAKSEVASSGEVVVCEGYTDVIAFFEAGVPRAVATCGTALADEHFRLLTNFADKRIVLAYDADSAGQAAAERFYEWEQKYSIDVAVAALPGGADPADVARNDPALLQKAVEEAKPFLEFRLDRVLNAADLSTAQGRARAAEAAVAVIAEHPSDFVRDQYVMRVADVCRVDADQVRQHVRAGKVPVRERSSPPRQHRDIGSEIEALRLAIHRPAEMAGRLHVVLFDDEINRQALEALTDTDPGAGAGGDPDVPPGGSALDAALALAAPEAAALLQRLAVEDADTEPDDVLSLLGQRAAERAWQGLLADARQSDNPTVYSSTIAWLKITIEHLREGESSAEALEQLVAWLVEFSEEGE